MSRRAGSGVWWLVTDCHFGLSTLSLGACSPHRGIGRHELGTMTVHPTPPNQVGTVLHVGDHGVASGLYTPTG